jgi:hypothetical protein
MNNKRKLVLALSGASAFVISNAYRPSKAHFEQWNIGFIT